MNPTSQYLERYGFPEQFIHVAPSSNLKLVVTIPCYDEPDLIDSLSALAKCDRTKAHVEVIVLINQPSGCSDRVVDRNSQTVAQFYKWADQLDLNWIRFHIAVKTDIPSRQAGVGLARKMAMDEAVRRLLWADRERVGVIVGFDADCTCDKNYLRAIEHHFDSNPRCDGCSIYFEHPLEGELSREIYEGIEQYELHLRYFVNGLKYSGFPYAFQTMGSAMAVRCPVYQKQGGMNRRKAGEDFHFLQKVMVLGNYSNLTTTRVIPSPRISDRVPFGTGKAMANWIDSKSPSRKTYNPEVFTVLKSWLVSVPQLHKARDSEISTWQSNFPEFLSEYLQELNFVDRINEINRQSVSQATFLNRFFRWFNALRVLKLIHHFRDNVYPNVEVSAAAKVLLEKSGFDTTAGISSRNLLMKFREIDRGV